MLPVLQAPHHLHQRIRRETAPDQGKAMGEELQDLGLRPKGSFTSRLEADATVGC